MRCAARLGVRVSFKMGHGKNCNFHGEEFDEVRVLVGFGDFET